MKPGIPVEESPAGLWVDRIASLLFVVAAVVIVWLLASVNPDPRGHGTHEALGMTPCGWAEQGFPCPTCGVTTSATWMVHLRPIRSVMTQPFGAGLTLFGLWLAGLALFCLLRRQSFVYRLTQLPIATLTISALVLFFGSWAWIWAAWPE